MPIFTLPWIGTVYMLRYVVMVKLMVVHEYEASSLFAVVVKIPVSLDNIILL